MRSRTIDTSISGSDLNNHHMEDIDTVELPEATIDDKDITGTIYDETTIQTEDFYDRSEILKITSSSWSSISRNDIKKIIFDTPCYNLISGITIRDVCIII